MNGWLGHGCLLGAPIVSAVRSLKTPRGRRCAGRAQNISRGVQAAPGLPATPMRSRGACAHNEPPPPLAMTAPTLTLNTDTVAPRDRAPQWREWVWQHFGGLESDFYGDTQFDGHMAASRAGDVILTRLEANRHRVLRTPGMARTSETAYLKIVAPWQGGATVQQQGREASARSGAWIIYDTTQPYEIANPEAVDHLIASPRCKPASAPKNGNCAATWPRATGWWRCMAGATWSSPTSAPSCPNRVGRGRAPLPHQPLRPHVRRDHCVKPDQGGHAVQPTARIALPGKPCGFCHPQRRTRGAARGRLRVAHPHARGRGRQRAKGRRAAHQPAKHLCAGLAGVPRVRRRGLSRCRKTAPAGRPGRGQLPHAAQPRVAHRGQDNCRCVSVDVHLREHLPHTDRRPGRRTDASYKT
jgi:hypothetical protein